MKQGFLLLCSAAALLTACSSNDNPGNDTGSTVAHSTPAIQLSVSAPQASIYTRGTGTVGGLVDTDGSTIITENKWAGQTINVFMVDKGTTNLSRELDMDGNATGDVLYNFTSMTTPADNATGTAQRTDNAVKYYPPTGNFDFWAYHADNATDPANATPREDFNFPGCLVLPFSIDGSQDLMTAKAELTKEQQETMRQQTGKENNYYSAFAARRNVQPQLNFHHELTRLTFTVTANSATEADPTSGVYITGIKVYSKDKGNLIVAYTPDTQLSSDATLAVFSEDSAALVLKAREENASVNSDLIAISDNKNNVVHPDYDATTSTSKPKSVGEALIVAPADHYTIVVNMRQHVLTYHDPTGKTQDQYTEKAFSQKAVIRPVKGSFLKGHSYNVNIKIYGLEDIQISTTLSPWIKGEDIDVDEDK